MAKNIQRRLFFKKMIGIAGFAALAPTLLSSLIGSTAAAEEKRRGKKPETAGAGGDLDLPLTQPGKGMAAGVNYQHDHAAVKDAALKTVRQGVPFEKQYCSNCLLYTSVGKKNGEELGKCTLFQKELVKAKGWCTSWAKKA